MWAAIVACLILLTIGWFGSLGSMWLNYRRMAREIKKMQDDVQAMNDELDRREP